MPSSIDILLVENALLKSHLGNAQKKIQELEERLSLKKLPGISTRQQIELFEKGLKVIDYQRPLYQCQNCRKKKFAQLLKGVSASNFGFRLSSVIALMTGSFHLSKREVPALMKQLFGIHISSGSIHIVNEELLTCPCPYALS